jgi:hypothetical protein
MAEQREVTVNPRDPNVRARKRVTIPYGRDGDYKALVERIDPAQHVPGPWRDTAAPE